MCFFGYVPVSNALDTRHRRFLDFGELSPLVRQSIDSKQLAGYLADLTEAHWLKFFDLESCLSKLVGCLK